MAGDINRVTLVGRLTRDPELRHIPSGTAVLELGLAVNGRQQDEAGNWVDKPNFFDVKVYGRQAETLAQHLQKGRRIGIDGRLDWRSWEAQDGTKRSKVDVVAQNVQFLDSRSDGEAAAGAAAGTSRATSLRPRATSRRPRPTTTSRSRRPRMAAKTQPRKRAADRDAGGRRKSCHFCKDKIAEVDFKNANQLRRYISEKGKIRNRRMTGACRRHQRQVAVAVKRAREMALLPYAQG